MATVLLAWELGGGFGHLNRLLSVARGLAKLGHRPIIAGRNIIEPRPLLRGDEFPILQAPVWQRRREVSQQPFTASGFTDILAAYGFGTADHLYGMVQAWQALLDLVRPAVIVADYAPTLCAAAYGDVPVVQVGCGFTMPPAHRAMFPTLNTGTAPPTADGRLHEVVREVQKRRGRPEPETLTAVFRTAARFIFTWPELDPYRAVRDEPYVGPIEHPAPAPAEATNNKAFVYLSSTYPSVSEILQRLTQAGLAAEAHVRGISSDVTAQLRSVGLALPETPPVLESALAKAGVILHHGGISSTMTALALGRPQMLLPQHLEQKLTAHALQQLGVGKWLSGRMSIEQILQNVRELSAPEYIARAGDLANSLWQRKTANALDSVLEVCDSLIQTQAK